MQCTRMLLAIEVIQVSHDSSIWLTHNRRIFDEINSQPSPCALDVLLYSCQVWEGTAARLIYGMWDFQKIERGTLTNYMCFRILILGEDDFLVSVTRVWIFFPLFVIQFSNHWVGNQAANTAYNSHYMNEILRT